MKRKKIGGGGGLFNILKDDAEGWQSVFIEIAGSAERRVWILSGRGRFLRVTSISRSIVQLRTSIGGDIRSAWSTGFQCWNSYPASRDFAPRYIFQYTVKRGRERSRIVAASFNIYRMNVFYPNLLRHS